MTLHADPTSAVAIAEAEPVLDDLPLAGIALESLCARTGVRPGRLEIGPRSDGWAAEVTIDGATLLLFSPEGKTWGIYAPQGAAPAELADAVRALQAALA